MFQINGETDQSFTHEEIRSSSISLGSALTRLGIGKGHVVGIVSPNCPEFLISFLGVASIGAVNTTVNCTYTSGMYIYLILINCLEIILVTFLVICSLDLLLNSSRLN